MKEIFQARGVLKYSGSTSRILTWIKDLQDEIVRNSSTDEVKPGYMQCTVKVPLAEGMDYEKDCV